MTFFFGSKPSSASRTAPETKCRGSLQGGESEHGLLLRLHAFLDKDEILEEREEQRLLLAARRGSRQKNSRRQARWADADDDEGFSKQEWNPAQPMTYTQVDRVRVAKPFEVLAGFLASSAAACCFKARACGLLIGGLGAIGSGRAVEGAVEAAASDDKTPHCNICLASACPRAVSQSRVVSAADAVG